MDGVGVTGVTGLAGFTVALLFPEALQDVKVTAPMIDTTSNEIDLAIARMNVPPRRNR
jgi:hypothetical protein